MKFGYARVSTTDQNLDLQINALRSAGCETVYQEKVSTRAADRPELTKLLEHVRAGDAIVIWKLDRLDRGTVKLITLVTELKDTGVGLISLNDPLDTTTAQGQFLFNIFASLAEYERSLTRERTMAGLAAAKLQGRTGGKKPGLTDDAKKQARIVESLYKEGHSVSVIAKQLSISRTTAYKYLEFVLDVYLAKRFRIMEIKAIRSIASELSTVFSTSRNKRPHRRTGLKLSQPKLRSTGQRFFSGTKPRLLSGFYGPPLRCNLNFPAMLLLNMLNKTDFIAMIGRNQLQTGYFAPQPVYD